MGAGVKNARQQASKTSCLTSNPPYSNSMKETNVVIKYPAERNFEVSLEGDTHPEILENAFAAFNGGSGREHPEFLASRARSLSVNDLVMIEGAWYQCASFGWTPLTESDVMELEKAVKEHSAYEVHGAWFALSEIMWDRKLAKKKEVLHNL